MENRNEMFGRRLDRHFRTGPLFETIFLENGLSRSDRWAVLYHTTSAIKRHWSARVHFAVSEIFDLFIFRLLAQGRVPPFGMNRLFSVEDLSWYQVHDWDVAQRARRAFGRVPRRSDCTTLYCGWRRHVRKGEPLPVFVLMDRHWKVLEVAYVDSDCGQAHELRPGIGPDLRPSTDQVMPALRALAHELGIEDIEDQLLGFIGR